MESTDSSTREPKHLGWLQISAIVILAMLATAAGTFWLVKSFLFPSEFTPVSLSEREQSVLSAKLESLDKPWGPTDRAAVKPGEPLTPEAYSEAGASREINFSERELNSLLANNTDLAKRVAIDLADGLISARILVPMDEDFPLFGGQTLRARTGIEFAFRNERPVVRLKGVSIMGVPLPNAWLGGLKNIDLIEEFGNDDGFWKTFADGIAAIEVEEGRLKLKLKE
ncbi:MAG: arginine N-succinyltransferase [Gammaproteobacteria bacterium]|nr:arginine N-succinyltransferase [Gammaproteobacteria bacterium]